jgi:hypothetical protein
MFWFPEPEQPGPEVLKFLAVEKEYLTGDWTLAMVLMALLVPASLAALALAFWKRSLFYELAVINAIMLTKIAWSFYYGGDSGGLCTTRSRGRGHLRCGDPVRCAPDARESEILTLRGHLRRLLFQGYFLAP